MKLVFGVDDIPYANSEGTTTGDVAEILESKYHLMEVFYEEHQGDIAGLLEEGLKDQLENLLMGAPPSNKPFAGSCSEIEHMFKAALSSGEFERLGIPGTPTQAALDGVSHRLKRPYVKSNPRRPSFIDTGLYQQSFAVEVE